MKTYNVKGMSCAACSARVEKAVSAVDGVVSCSVNLLTASMTVEGGNDDTVISAVRRAGYDASPKDAKTTRAKPDEADNEAGRELRVIVGRLVASFVLLLALMYVSMGHVMWGFPLPRALAANPVAIALIELLLSLCVLVINQRFFVNGFRGLVHRAPNMDTLVALGSSASFAWSTYLLFKMTFDAAAGGAHLHEYLHGLYFESAAMILALITLGKLLEAVAKGKTTNAIKSLIALTPKEAHVVREGRELVIPSSEVLVGDLFVVRPGESFPVDGTVESGESTADESALTGESIPVEKSHGGHVFAGSVNLSGYLECRATKVGDDTVMGELVHLVSDTAASKAPIAKVADRVSGIFVPAVMAIAFVTALVWLFVNKSWSDALSHGIAVLVVSCPCALGLATPVAIMVGSGIGARGGVLFKSAAALEATGRASVIALDKTGTITSGAPSVTDVIPFEVSDGELLRLAASLEIKSEHPLAAAVVAKADELGVALAEARGFEALVGHGVRAEIEGAPVFGGSLKFIAERFGAPDKVAATAKRLSETGKTPLLFVRQGEVIGIIAVADAVRPSSAAAVRALKALELRVVMLTGDNERTARAVAASVGIDEVIAEVLPAEKAQRVSELASSAGVIMVGDGINDAPALTAADVGIAIGNGTDIAIESADVVLMRAELDGAVGAVRLGRAVLTNIKENLFWAFCYNLVGIPLAAGVFIPLFGVSLTPMFGAAAMSFSSFFVVMNALRLNLKHIFKSTDKSTDGEARRDGQKENDKMIITLNVKGMMCSHCEARVREALLAVEGVASATADAKAGVATVELSREVAPELLVATVKAAGYECHVKA